MCVDGHEEEEKKQEAKKRAEPTFWRGCKGGGVSCFDIKEFLNAVFHMERHYWDKYWNYVRLHDPSTWNSIRDSTAMASFSISDIPVR